MGKPIDITGQRFGSLVALRPTEKRDSTRGVIWLCRCDCGMEVEVRANCLKRGETRSCGCRRSASSAMNIRKAFAKNPPKKVVPIPKTKKPVAKKEEPEEANKPYEGDDLWMFGEGKVIRRLQKMFY